VHPAVAIAVPSAVILAALASRVGDWAVMTDELLYERLALSIAQTGAPVPALHGEVVNVAAITYPLVLAPVFALVPMPWAVLVAHAWNGILFASAAIPVYLLARRLVASWAPVALGIGAVALPWSVLTGFLMSENAAYPAFAWAFYAVFRATVEPSGRSDLLAVGAIVVATLARPQLVVLGLVFAVAALAQELRFGRRWRSHGVLFVASAAVLLIVLVAVATGSVGSLLGSYATTVEGGNVLSGAALRSAAVHLDVLAVALCIVPLLLGGGWALETAVRGRTAAEPQALASLVVVTVLVLALQVGSFVSRFALGADVKDRYLFYVAPLLLVATVVALADARRSTAGILVVAAFFVLTVSWERFEPVLGVNLDTPASVIHEALHDVADAIGASAATLVTSAGGALAVLLVIGLRTLPRRLFSTVLVTTIVAAVALETGYAWGRLLGSNSPEGAPIVRDPGDADAWIDRAVPADAQVGMLPFPIADEWFASAVAWWNVEFWNARVTRAYLVGGWFVYTPLPFPRPHLEANFATGALAADVPRYVVRTTLDSRFRPVGTTVATSGDLEVLRLDDPPRVAWAMRDVTPDGWTPADAPGRLRVYGDGRVDVRLTVTSPDAAVLRLVSVGAGGVALNPRESREVTLRVCAKGHADLPIRVDEGSSIRALASGPRRVPRFRRVGVRVSRVVASPAAGSCDRN